MVKLKEKPLLPPFTGGVIGHLTGDEFLGSAFTGKSERGTHRGKIGMVHLTVGKIERKIPLTPCQVAFLIYPM